MKLNIACGEDVRPPPWVNTDITQPSSIPDGYAFTKMDVTKPWQFKDEYLDEVFAGCILPHLARWEDVEHIIYEAHRVLKPGGIFTVTYPDPHDVAAAMGPPQHARLISPQTFTQYCTGAYRFGGDNPEGGIFTKLESGDYATPHFLHEKRHRGTSAGVSRIAPRFMRLGNYQLGAFTHVFRRMRAYWMLKPGFRYTTLTKPEVPA